MDPNTESTTTKQVTVDVPEERIAEFHAFFGRFLAGARGRRGRHGRPQHRGMHHHRGGHGHPCGRSRESAPQQTEAAAPQQATETTQL
jgi:hypothetical protein